MADATAKLSEEQLAELKKCSTDRLKIILAKADFAEDEVVKMDRPALLQAVAELWTTPKEPVVETERWKMEMQLR